MKSTVLSSLIFLAFASGLVSAASIDNNRSINRRKTSILIDAQPSLPSVGEAKAAASVVGLNLTNIQGDILIGMKKMKELFFFFGINDPIDFKAKLKSDIVPLVTSTTQLLSVSAQPTPSGDVPFSQGQFANAVTALKDPGTVNWVPQFAGTGIHGVILLASDTVDNVNDALANLQSTLGDSITEIYSLQGAARPGAQQGHEHFGYLDGISNPAVQGFQDPLPGQAVVQPGEILVGESGDPSLSTRPQWAQDGSFLAFRQLKQLVPEFNKFLTDNAIHAPALTPKQGADLLGARMIGRWKSGAPVFLSPMIDNPTLGADPTRNNDFTYAAAGQNTSDPTDQSNAHIRKASAETTRPRADLGPSPEATSSKHHIVRGGIPYGPEQSDAEIASNTTQTERGLAFVYTVGYQSSIAAGFQFLQKTWANNANFVHANVGIDPIIGANAGAPRVVNGLDPTIPSRNITLLIDFVVSRGGEYFFSPSISALATTLSD
ncbi:fungal peroxidase [Mycena amicta]|nr:fungal peroxidase [Mycena amicta]